MTDIISSISLGEKTPIIPLLNNIGSHCPLQSALDGFNA